MTYTKLSMAARLGLMQMPLRGDDYERLVKEGNFSSRTAKDLEKYYLRFGEIRALRFTRGHKFRTLKNELKELMTNILTQLQDEHR